MMSEPIELMARYQLETEVAELRDRCAQLEALLADALSALILEKTVNSLLPGWDCAECKVFNGEAKAGRMECRVCGWKPRP